MTDTPLSIGKPLLLALGFALIAAQACTPTHTSSGVSESSPAPAPQTTPATAPVTPPNDRPKKENVQPAATLPAGITIDRDRKLVQLDAKVVLREGWLELLACTPGTKEHESILSVNTPPSVIHFALLTIGAEPGSPIRIESRGEELVAIPPSGSVIAIELTYEDDGQAVTVPANQWVYNEASQAVMADNHWVFAGSKLREFEEGAAYIADLDGAAVSLVNFGSELLAKPNRLTDSNAVHGENFVVNTEVIPPLGTPVTLTLRLLDPPATAPVDTP
ncbi:MAG: YdjY domain-containing protein [Planctomycetota bacterium]